MFGGTQPYTFDRVVRIGLTVVVLWTLFLLVRYLADVLIPFAIAVVLAYFLNPLVNVFEERLKRRWAAVAFTLGGFVIVGLAVGVLMIPLIYSQVSRFGVSLERLQADLHVSAPIAPSQPDKIATTTSAPTTTVTGLGLSELLTAWSEFGQDAGTKTRAQRFSRFRDRIKGTYIGDTFNDTIIHVRSADFRAQIASTVAEQLYAGGRSVVNFFSQVLVGVIAAVLVIIYLFFLLLDFPQFAATWQSFLPQDYRGTIVEFLREFEIALRRYFRGQFVVAALTGILFAIGFTIIGLPMALPMALLIAALNMVPYLQSISLVPALFLAVVRSVEGDSSIGMSILLVLIVYGVVQVLQDTVITPRVMGQATGLRPVAILLGVFIWGRLLGFLGLILAIPLTCLFIVYYRRLVMQRTSIVLTTTEGPPP